MSCSCDGLDDRFGFHTGARSAGGSTLRKRQAADALREADKEKVRTPETKGSLTVNLPSRPLIGLPKVEQEVYLVKLSDDVLRAAEEAQTTRDKVNPIKVNSIRF